MLIINQIIWRITQIRVCTHEFTKVLFLISMLKNVWISVKGIAKKKLSGYSLPNVSSDSL